MPKILVKRGLRADLDTAAAAAGLATGEPYLITDEKRLAIGVSASAYEPMAKQSEAGGSTQLIAFSGEIPNASVGKYLGFGAGIVVGNRRGIVLPWASAIIGLGLSAFTIGVSIELGVTLDGVAEGTTISLPGTEKTSVVLGTPIVVAANQSINAVVNSNINYNNVCMTFFLQV